MVRGTTPYVEINTDLDLSDMDYVVLTIQDSTGTEVSIDNSSGMMEVTPEKITVKLTQDQTFALSEGDLQMQVRASSEDGTHAVASNIMYSYLENVLYEEVIP